MGGGKKCYKKWYLQCCRTENAVEVQSAPERITQRDELWGHTAVTWRGMGGRGQWVVGAGPGCWFLLCRGTSRTQSGAFCLCQFLVVCHTTTRTTTTATTTTATSLQRNQTMWHRGETEWDEAFVWLSVNRVDRYSWFYMTEGLCLTSEFLFCCYINNCTTHYDFMGAAEVVISGQFIPVSPSEVYEEPKRKHFCYLEQKNWLK